MEKYWLSWPIVCYDRSLITGRKYLFKLHGWICAPVIRFTDFERWDLCWQQLSCLCRPSTWRVSGGCLLLCSDSRNPVGITCKSDGELQKRLLITRYFFRTRTSQGELVELWKVIFVSFPAQLVYLRTTKRMKSSLLKGDFKNMPSLFQSILVSMMKLL